MSDARQYTVTRSKVKVMSPWKLEILPFTKSYHVRYLQQELATEHGFLNQGTISKFVRARFLIFVLVFSHMTLNLTETSVVKNQP